MRRKVNFKLFTPLLHEFEFQLESSHMKRDSFLAHLVERELSHLADDLSGKRLSVSARRFISSSLKRLGTTQINVQLDSTTARNLDEVIQDLNIVRDSFINRLLYFSLGSDPLIEYFELGTETSAMHKHSHPLSYFQATQEIQADPLASLRKALKAKHGIGLYLAQLPIELAGFECYLDDEIFWRKYSGLSNNSNINNFQSFKSTFTAAVGHTQHIFNKDPAA